MRVNKGLALAAPTSYQAIFRGVFGIKCGFRSDHGAGVGREAVASTAASNGGAQQSFVRLSLYAWNCTFVC